MKILPFTICTSPLIPGFAKQIIMPVLIILCYWGSLGGLKLGS
jgi:hypothetical protein